MFKVASQNRVFEDVVHQIQEAILDGRLNAGDTLPSERDLKTMFDTSRGTLREALRVLEERGLIEIRLGVHGGSVVKGVSSSQPSVTLARLVRSRQVSLRHLAEFREGMEGNVASLAAQQATADDVARLKALLEEAADCIANDDRDGFLEIDRQIHLAMAGITGNPVYVFIFHSIHDNIHRYYDHFLSLQGRELTENYQDLCDIVRAVANTPRPDEARIMAQSHVHRFHRHMQARADAGDHPPTKKEGEHHERFADEAPQEGRLPASDHRQGLCQPDGDHRCR